MQEAKYCYAVHADTPSGKSVTYPVGDTDEEAYTKATAIFPKGSKITKVVNEDTGNVTTY